MESFFDFPYNFSIFKKVHRAASNGLIKVACGSRATVWPPLAYVIREEIASPKFQKFGQNQNFWAATKNI